MYRNVITRTSSGYKPQMPRDGAIIFADLIGKLDVLRVVCDKCRRAGHYPLRNLIGSRPPYTE
jgi:hypothetical protein